MGRWKKTKIDPADKVFSEFIRTRAGWKCEYCGKDYSNNGRGLHCSHYWSRSRENTRYDPENCVALCFYHHQLLGHGDGRDEYRELMTKRLGEARFEMLMVRANTYKKKDRKAALLISKQLLRDLGGG